MHSGVTTQSPVPDDHEDGEFNSTTEETSPDDPAEQSGHVHQAETSTAEGTTVTEDFNSETTVLKSDQVTLLASPVYVTLSPPSVEVEASSQEIITFIPESNASSGAEPLEDIQDKLEQEGLGQSSVVFHSTTQTITDTDPEVGETDKIEGSGESSGESPQTKPELLLTRPTLSADHTSEGIDDEAGTDAPSPSEIKITLIPHLTLTPGWKPEPSSPAPQESRSDGEYSAEPPVTEESDNTVQEVMAEVTTGSFTGKVEL